MAKLLYKGEIEINGKIIYENGTLCTIQLDAGGTMTVSRIDVELVPDKPKKKKKQAEDGADLPAFDESEE